MPPSPQESPVLRAEYAARAGKAAAYREAAGIDRQDQAVALEAHRDRPELEAMRREVIMALEIRDEAEIMRGMTRGELEARVLEGERAMANAPRDVSAKLRNAAQAQQDCWQQSVEAEVAGNEAEAEGARALAGLLGSGAGAAREGTRGLRGLGRAHRAGARRGSEGQEGTRAARSAGRGHRRARGVDGRLVRGVQRPGRRGRGGDRARTGGCRRGRGAMAPGARGARARAGRSPRTPVLSPRWPEREKGGRSLPFPP